MKDEGKRHIVPEEGGHPTGTLVILLIYLVVIIGLWGSVFLILLQRA
ncbi:MAG: cytochrome c oxidase subunit 2A [Sphaerobacter sp.]|nr:cytochrome c oxidase subunit 2A [Sphaerobacter sp.]